MKIIQFFQSLGLAEILITLALILICVVAWFDGRKLDKKLDRDISRFDEKYPR